jgi:hypothetical protein
MEDRALRIYLEDHLAGSTLAVELAARLQRQVHSGPLADFLATFLQRVEEERNLLEGLIRELGGRSPLVKHAGAWLGEKGMRLKLQLNPFHPSGLGRFEELEVLRLGVEGKLALWRTLEDLSKWSARLSKLPLAKLKSRAEEQIQQFEYVRLLAARQAFAPERANESPANVAPAN